MKAEVRVEVKTASAVEEERRFHLQGQRATADRMTNSPSLRVVAVVARDCGNAADCGISKNRKCQRMTCSRNWG